MTPENKATSMIDALNAARQLEVSQNELNEGLNVHQNSLNKLFYKTDEVLQRVQNLADLVLSGTTSQSLDDNQI